MSSDISDYLQTTNSISRADINKILTALQQIRPPIERDAFKVDVAFEPLVRVRTTTVVAGSPNVISTQNRKRESTGTTTMMQRKKPLTVNSYPLVHTTTGTLTFPTAGHKFAGNGVFDGATYALIDHHTRLNLSKTSPFTIAFWFKVASAGSSMVFVGKCNDIEVLTNIGWTVFRTSSNFVHFRFLDGSGTLYEVGTSPTTFTDNAWHSCVVTFSGNGNRSGMKLYIDGTLIITGSALTITGDLTNSLKVGVGAEPDTLRKLTGSMAWLTILAKEVSSTWVTAFHSNPLIDTSGTNIEILTIPFVGDEKPRPDATTGLCRST